MSSSPRSLSKTQTPATEGGLVGLLRKLHSIEFGPSRGADRTRIRPAALAELLRLLLMLLENGLSLPKALSSLAADQKHQRNANLLHRLRMTIEAGGTLSSGMQHFPSTFKPMQVQQIRIGERSGALEKALAQVCEQVERQVALRKRIIRKVSYPVLVTLAGAGLMVFMCVVVVPEFETVYDSSGVDLPAVTQVVTGTSRMVIAWGWLAIPIFAVLAAAWAAARSRPRSARAVDQVLLRLPLIGPWLRDAAVLQFAETVSSMVECGYKPIEAVRAATDCVHNREVRSAVQNICSSMQRGERLSEQLANYPRFFSTTLCQLIGVGEQSGDFPKAMRGVCEHLRERLETRVDTTVAMLEPTLTITLAAAIGGIVLSIYTPMFHMFEVLE